MKVWKNLGDVFRELNKKNINYIVLRNYEGLNDEKLLKYHEDVDFLCDNPQKLLNAIGAKPRATVNYYIKVRDTNIPIDIRWVGDGYYDKKWQINMLKNRKLYENTVYVPNNKDYFYSLLYHALIQKRKVPVDYEKRLIHMGKCLGIEMAGIVDGSEILNLFMKEKKYYYTNTKDSGVDLNFNNVPKGMLRINFIWFIQKKVLDKWRYVRGFIE